MSHYIQTYYGESSPLSLARPWQTLQQISGLYSLAGLVLIFIDMYTHLTNKKRVHTQNRMTFSYFIPDLEGPLCVF